MSKGTALFIFGIAMMNFVASIGSKEWCDNPWSRVIAIAAIVLVVIGWVADWAREKK